MSSLLPLCFALSSTFSLLLTLLVSSTLPIATFLAGRNFLCPLSHLARHRGYFLVTSGQIVSVQSFSVDNDAYGPRRPSSELGVYDGGHVSCCSYDLIVL